MVSKEGPRNLEQQRIARVLARTPKAREIAPLATALQEALGYVTAGAIEAIADRLDCPAEAIEAAVEEAPGLRRSPDAHARVTICTGKTCARRGGAELVKQARAHLGAEVFASSPDGAIYLEPFRCFGQCAMAPNIRIDGSVRGAMTAERFVLLLDMLRRRARKAAEDDEA